tara:strand:- start:494 stop:1303 length:810 start_codon:yes stop_codon:yes gene_type:complete
MKIIRSKKKLTNILSGVKNLGFVPTMGAIHKGHIYLVKKSMSKCNKTIVSIFVNKPQFNRKNDFKKYPRNLKKDISILKRLKVDFLFIPNMRQVYPDGQNKKIKITAFSKKLCGKSRPGHFVAVIDVIDRFLKLIKPSKMFLGNKDMQQLKIIENHILKNKISTKIIPCKTIRKNNGVPYSSRNFLLKNKEMNIASQVYKKIFMQKKKLIDGKISIRRIKNEILSSGVNKIDYIEILNVNKLIPPYYKKNIYKIFIAYYLKKVRLIDNI